ncbi:MULTISPECIES: hypothetical protein [unclassified Legionella]|uniref:hypothetical protein n=1 Tax=unclassified Legionella TaxID=2622702 RepID=UPI001055F78D|nr:MULTISPECIES: hypothetical protein [unclassified Legionella]MDI9819028.1 hypothetical protein [Legionella sp. PL877]
MSIACGIALEVSTFELLARSTGIKVNYLGCDISKSNLRFNVHDLQKKSPNVKQTYLYADVANSPPVAAIADAHCIMWRHPEFLSDHTETSKTLILDMCQILWNILLTKNDQAPLLITCYDPHEMRLVLELVQLLCAEEIQYELNIDNQVGRASWKNPTIDSQDRDPLFNLNHHDQCQLLITKCRHKKLTANRELFLSILSKAFQNILPEIANSQADKLSIILKKLGNPSPDALREAVSYLNDQIREDSNPFTKREQLLSLLSEDHQQPDNSQKSTCS